MVEIDYSSVAVVPNSLESNHIKIVCIFFSAVLSFVIYFIRIYVMIETEVQLIKRLSKWMRISMAVLIFSLVPLAYFMLKIQDDPLGRSWELGLGRPTSSFVVAVVGCFAFAHPLFRWSVLLFFPWSLWLDVKSEVNWDHELTCRDNGDCVEGNPSTSWVKFLIVRDLFSIFMQIWGILLTSYFLVACGAVSQRFSVRVLSGSRVSKLPTLDRSATRHHIL